jgi:hypothetical protein
LALVVRANASGGNHERLALAVCKRGECLLHVGFRQPQVFHASRSQPVEAARVLQHGGVAVLFHISQNRGDRRIDFLVLRVLERKQSTQARVEIRAGAVQTLKQRHLQGQARPPD